MLIRIELPQENGQSSLLVRGVESMPIGRIRRARVKTFEQTLRGRAGELGGGLSVLGGGEGDGGCEGGEQCGPGEDRGWGEAAF
jgi:hypothetical protein